MKRKLIAMAGVVSIAAAGVAAGLSISGATAQQEGKAPVILIVDRAQIVGDSKAGKTIPAQAQAIEATVRKELEAEAAKLQKDIEAFQKNASLMSDEVREKTERELTVRDQYALPQQAQIMDQAFRAVVQNAQGKILVEARPILQKILDERGATVMLDKSAVLYAAPETDITAQVISELDKKLDKVDVEKITFADVQKRLQEAAKAQQQQQSGKK